MEKKLILVILIICYLLVGMVNQSFCQVFSISDGPSGHYSIDHFANDVYYFDGITGELVKRNIPTWIASKTDFVTMPEFANKSWKAVFAKDTSILITDFENDSTWVLIDSAGFYREGSHLGYRFSPNDLILWYRDNFYSFRDNISYKVEPPYPITEQVWSSDSTIIMAGSDVRKFTEYNFFNAKVDTFLVLDEYKEITTYSYNVSRNILAYSLYPNRTEEYIPKIYLYDKETKETTVAFDPLRDDSSSICWGSPVSLTSLKWSDDETKLAFFSFGLTNSFSGVYIYDLDLDTTYRYTECEDYGLKYDLGWYNQDTLVFIYSQIYGIDVTSPITSIQEDENKLSLRFELFENYPNPFNPTTTISFSLPQQEKVELIVYDVLGRKVAEPVNQTMEAGRYDIDFNGSNLSSGTYIYKITAGKFAESKKMLLIK